MKTLKYFIIFFFISSFAYATDYWVRPLGGSYGSEDGSTWANAYDGFADAETEADLSAGDTLIICNEHFEQLDVWVSGSDATTNRVFFTGDCPDGVDGTINGSDEYSGSSWTEEPSNIWYVTDANLAFDSKFALFGTESQSNVGIWEDAKLDLDAQGEFWKDNPNDRMYIYSTSDPSTAYSNGIYLPIDDRRRLLTSDGFDYISISNLTIKYFGQNAIRIHNGDYWYVHNNIIKYGGGYECDGCSGHGGAAVTAHEDVAYHEYYQNKITQIYDEGIAPHLFTPSAAMSEFDVYDNEISFCGNGISFHTNVAGTSATIDDITVHNNTIIYSGDGWAGTEPSGHGSGIKFVNNASGATIEGITITNNIVDTYTWNGLRLYNVGGAIVVAYNQFLNGNDDYSTDDNIGIEVNGSGAIDVAADLYYNLIAGVEQYGILVINNAAAADFFNNTIYDAGESGKEAVYMNNSSGGSFKNNIVMSLDSICYRDGGTAQTSNNNQFYRASGDVFQWGATPYTTIADWRTNSSPSQDADSNQGDPLFVSVGNDNYRLESGSPAVDDGEDLSLTEDLIGYPVGSAPDMGAYEYYELKSVQGLNVGGGNF